MDISLEYKKIKRTEFFFAFLGGGILAGAVPIINMVVRSKMYLNLPGNPIQILLDANWQMMAMLNVLLIVVGTCLLYHIEYADNAMQKMKSLPIRESSIFFGKAFLIILMMLFVIIIEASAITFCTYHWFKMGNQFFGELCQYFGYSFLLMLPCIILSLLISEACKNMWISLGIGVVCVFIATLLPTSNFPYAMPFHVFASATFLHSLYIAAIELTILSFIKMILIKVRRVFE